MANTEAQKYRVIGLMSGTSLDGLDIAFCEFSLKDGTWSYQTIQAETIDYFDSWKERILSLENTNALSFQQAHADYGHFLGKRVNEFIIRHKLKADFVSSHGHTIFHQPDKKLTVQIGAGEAIAAECKLPVICDFRSLDVALGGQGAPLVPIGDKLLFPDYDYCLNLGGFANVSYEHKGKRIAFDVCPVNIVMNAICEKMGKKYDDEGRIARTGMVSNYLLNEFNNLPFYRYAANSPKSLGKEWVIQYIDPLIEQYEVADNDLLCTFCEHIAFQISRALNTNTGGKILITGGGTYNTFLIERIKDLCNQEIIIPDRQTIEFKEALIFAFLGVLRMRNEPNCLSSVTGSKHDNCGGAVFYY